SFRELRLELRLLRDVPRRQIQCKEMAVVGYDLELGVREPELTAGGEHRVLGGSGLGRIAPLGARLQQSLALAGKGLLEALVVRQGLLLARLGDGLKSLLQRLLALAELSLKGRELTWVGGAQLLPLLWRNRVVVAEELVLSVFQQCLDMLDANAEGLPDVLLLALEGFLLPSEALHPLVACGCDLVILDKFGKRYCPLLPVDLDGDGESHECLGVQVLALQVVIER